MKVVAFWPFSVICLALLAFRVGWEVEAVVLGIFALVLMVCLMWLELWKHHTEELEKRAWLYDSRTKFTMAVGSQDLDTRKFLADQWPELGVDFGVEPILYILRDGLNTGINLEFFRKFMMDSSDKEFADVRSYNDDKTLQERFHVSRETVREQWQKCVGFLTREGYLIPNSALGPHSYMWKSKGHYRKLARQYLGNHVLIDLSEAQGA